MNSNELHPYQFAVHRELRSSLKNHFPLVIWLTGYSGSGKSTIANALEARLVHEYKAHAYILDGDNIRSGLNSDLGFSEEDRNENIRRVGEVAKLMYDAGLIVITAFISPFQAERNKIRNLFAPNAFWEVFVSCPLEICKKRDPKGLYAKAVIGNLKEFTGVSSPYEIPLTPELILNSNEFGIEECVSELINLMIKKKILISTSKKV
jgi:adenylylsulfate kinase